MRKKWIRLIGLWIAIVFTCAACSSSGGGKDGDEAAAPDLAYEIVTGDKIPQKLSEKILRPKKQKRNSASRIETGKTCISHSASVKNRPEATVFRLQPLRIWAAK